MIGSPCSRLFLSWMLYGLPPRSGVRQRTVCSWQGTVEFVKKLFMWTCLGVGVSVACLAWRPITGEESWTVSIEHGELVLVAVTLLASAIGYAAMASVSGGPDLVKHAVIGLGLVALILAIGVYAGFSDPPAGASVNVRQTAGESYVLLACSIFLGSLSTYVTHRSE